MDEQASAVATNTPAPEVMKPKKKTRAASRAVSLVQGVALKSRMNCSHVQLFSLNDEAKVAAIFSGGAPEGADPFGDLQLSPIQVSREGLRGLQNTEGAAKSQSKSDGSDSLSLSLPLVMENAVRPAGCRAMVATVTVQFLPLAAAIHSATNAKATGDQRKAVKDYREQHSRWVKSMVESAAADPLDGPGCALDDVCLRIARNLVMGTPLWRNLDGAYGLATRVSLVGWGSAPTKIDAVMSGRDLTSLYQFSPLGPEIEGAVNAVAREIRSQLQGYSLDALEVTYVVRYAMAGGPVYPSQNYVPTLGSKVNDTPSRYLLRDNTEMRTIRELAEHGGRLDVGAALIRNTKAANALRTIDTWFSRRKSETGYDRPIPIEPMGASLYYEDVIRADGERAIDYFLDVSKLESLPAESDELRFVIGMLVRGGLITKEKPKKTSEDTPQPPATGTPAAAAEAAPAEPAAGTEE